MTGEFAVAVHAMVYLYHKASCLSSEELAKNVCTNPARIRKVMAKLKKAGLVETREGAEGGCRIAKDGQTTLGEILKALGENAVTLNWRSGHKDAECLISAGMGGVMEGICAQLDQVCEEYLSTVTIESLEQYLIGKK
ncbi:RrF2 family transcriptional regulator [Acidaminobacterium chupaoyuni]